MPDQTLAQSVKAKYPGVYDDIPDVELETKIKAKYPGVYDDLPSTKGQDTTTQTAAPVSQLGEAWQAVKDIVGGTLQMAGHAGDAMHGYPQALTEDLKNLVGAHKEQFAKAKEAFTASASPNEPLGQRAGQALIGVQHGLAAAIPVQGPMAAGVAEDVSTGHYGRAGVNAAALFAPYAHDTLKPVAETVGRGVEAAGDAVGATKAADALNAKWKGIQTARAEASTAKANQSYYENLTKAIGPTAKDPARSVINLTRAKPYLVVEHSASPIEAVQHVIDAANKGSETIQEHVQNYVGAFKNDLIRTDPMQAATKALESMPGSGPSDVAAGLKELKDRGLAETPTLEKSFNVLTRLNAENKSVLAANRYDVANARATDPKFVAREAAADALRSGIYDQLEARGVSGVRALRQDQGALIAVRNAAQKQAFNGTRGVGGTGKTSLPAQIAGKAVEIGAVAGGAEIGGPIGAAAGHVLGRDLTSRFLTKANLTRDALVAKAFKKATAEAPQFPTVPAQAAPRGLLQSPAIALQASPDTSYVRSVPRPRGFGARVPQPIGDVGVGQMPHAILNALTEKEPPAAGADALVNRPVPIRSEKPLVMPRNSEELHQFVNAPVPNKFKDLNIHEQREVKRILEELKAFTFDQPGRAKVPYWEQQPESALAGERQPNAPVYQAFQGETKRTGPQIRASLQMFIRGGRATKIVEDAVREARRHLYDSTEAQPRMLPNDAGRDYQEAPKDLAVEFPFGENKRGIR